MSKYPNSGTLGKNKRREKESHPEYAGQCEVDGVAYWISAWVKQGDDGKFFSLSFRPKDVKPERPPVGGRGAQGDVYRTQRNDDPPF